MNCPVLTYTLCRDHDVYYRHACPVHYLADMRRREEYTGRPNYEGLGDLALLASTSTRLPPVP